MGRLVLIFTWRYRGSSSTMWNGSLEIFQSNSIVAHTLKRSWKCGTTHHRKLPKSWGYFWPTGLTLTQLMTKGIHRFRKPSIRGFVHGTSRSIAHSCRKNASIFNLNCMVQLCMLRLGPNRTKSSNYFLSLVSTHFCTILATKQCQSWSKTIFWCSNCWKTTQLKGCVGRLVSDMMKKSYLTLN